MHSAIFKNTIRAAIHKPWIQQNKRRSPSTRLPATSLLFQFQPRRRQCHKAPTPTGPSDCKCFHTTPSEPAVCSPSVTRILTQAHPVTPQSMIRGGQVSGCLTFSLQPKTYAVMRTGLNSASYEWYKKSPILYLGISFYFLCFAELGKENFMIAQIHLIAGIQNIVICFQ